MYHKAKYKRAELLSTPELRERGWTPAVVRDLLGEPDDTRPNPHSKAAAPMRLWLKERVEATEGTAEFRDRADRARRRAEISRVWNTLVFLRVSGRQRQVAGRVRRWWRPEGAASP